MSLGLILFVVYLIGIPISYAITFGSFYHAFPILKESHYETNKNTALGLCWMSWFVIFIVMLVFYSEDKKFYPLKWK